jgi:hypothetical protein
MWRGAGGEVFMYKNGKNRIAFCNNYDKNSFLSDIFLK